MFKTYLENRRLKAALETADIKVLDAKEERNEAKEKSLELQRDFHNLKTAHSDAVTQLEKTKKLVREQTGADLLVNALRELGVVPKPAKYDSFAEQARLQGQLGGLGGLQQQQARQLGQASQFGGLFGG